MKKYVFNINFTTHAESETDALHGLISELYGEPQNFTPEVYCEKCDDPEEFCKCDEDRIPD